MRKSLVLAIVAVCACLDSGGEPGPFRIRDTLGEEFFWVCDDDGRNCEVHRIAGVSPLPPECDEEATPVFGYLKQFRFFVVYGGCEYDEGTVWFGRDRIVVCEEDVDCPQREGRTFVCRAELCQDANADGLTYVDMFQLCFADLPREESLDYGYPLESELTQAIFDACPAGNALGECEGPLPAGCLDPG